LACVKSKTEKTPGKGTIHFRAPEIAAGNAKNFEAADVYSLGVILFFLKFGRLPYSENQEIAGYDLWELMHRDINAFWEAHCDINDGVPLECGHEFKILFESMVKFNPNERIPLKDIKKNIWVLKDVYHDEEMKEIYTEVFEGN